MKTLKEYIAKDGRTIQFWQEEVNGEKIYWRKVKGLSSFEITEKQYLETLTIWERAQNNYGVAY